MAVPTRTTLYAGMLAGLIALPAFAQSTRDRVTTLEAEVQRLQRLLENNQASQTDLLNRLQALQSENATLRDSIERLQFETGQSGDRQRQLYLDLDQRLQALEAGGAVAATAALEDAATPVAGDAPTETDSVAYQAAFDELKAGRYDEAQAGFSAFLAAYPDSAMRGNAQYWLAETYYVTKDFETALGKFQTVVTDYGTTRKVPDAWLKIGYCNYELQRWDGARTALNTVVTRYADSTAARLAEQRLEQMRKEGR